MPTPEYTSKDIERFWSKVDKTSSPNGCWIWMRYRMKNGYATFYHCRQKKLSHRVSWEIVHGEIPVGLEVCHNCPGGDNRACCNPEHLFLGTQQDNMDDKIRKGHGNRGEKHGHAKLTDVDVAEIRRLHTAKEFNQRQLALVFKTPYQTINGILMNKRRV